MNSQFCVYETLPGVREACLLPVPCPEWGACSPVACMWKMCTHAEWLIMYLLVDVGMSCVMTASFLRYNYVSSGWEVS